MSRRPLFTLPFKALATALLACAVVVALVGLPSLLWGDRWLTTTQLLAVAGRSQDSITIAWAVAAMVYGSARALAFHPSLRPSYATWLSGTAWRPGRPLPLGPPHLVWEDAVPVAMAVVLSPWPVAPLLVFAACHAALAMRVAFHGSDRRWVLASFALAAGGVALTWPHARALATIAIALLAACDVAVRRSLADLPWVRPCADAGRAAAAARRASQWVLAPVPPPSPLSAGDAWTIAGVACWCAYCFTYRLVVEDPRNAPAVLAIVFPLAAAGLIRWALYGSGHRAPIGPWGRLRTGRLIIPGYDVAAIAPLTAMALGIAVPVGLWLAGVGVPVAAAVGTLATAAVLLRAGPTRRRWDLTGHHRIVPFRRTGTAPRRPAG